MKTFRRSLTTISRSPQMQQLLQRADVYAATPATILIQGESGTGKGLLAEYLHQHSQVAHGPFLAVNCAALSEAVIESELFGHEPGAFTGAVQQRKGRLELAAGGTLFLDEIGELSLALQAKLLRVLEEGDYQRVGGTTTLQLQARVILATNRDLQQAVNAGKFREDLLYRINPLELQTIPLRERMEDLNLLIDELLQQFRCAESHCCWQLSPSARTALHTYHWPGNLRELRNLLYRHGILSQDRPIEAVDLPATPPRTSGLSSSWETLTLSEIERLTIEARLRQFQGHQGRTAASLGITSRTLRNKLVEYRKLRVVG
jgi:transcriptional regulator with PAS, ATPase and Fis domain